MMKSNWMQQIQTLIGQKAGAMGGAEGIGKLLALTPNDEANTLSARKYEKAFGRAQVYQLRASGTDRRGLPPGPWRRWARCMLRAPRGGWLRGGGSGSACR